MSTLKDQLRTMIVHLAAIGLTREEVLKSADIIFIEYALMRHQGNQCDAADWLGMHRNTMGRKISEYGIDVIQFLPIDSRRLQISFRSQNGEAGDVPPSADGHRASASATPEKVYCGAVDGHRGTTRSLRNSGYQAPPAETSGLSGDPHRVENSKPAQCETALTGAEDGNDGAATDARKRLSESLRGTVAAPTLDLKNNKPQPTDARNLRRASDEISREGVSSDAPSSVSKKPPSSDPQGVYDNLMQKIVNSKRKRPSL